MRTNETILTASKTNVFELNASGSGGFDEIAFIVMHIKVFNLRPRILTQVIC